MYMSKELSDARVIVVGAGAVGSCIAYRLAQAGADVVIVERGYPGGATSGNSFAWLNAFAKFPRAYYRLNLQSIHEHRDLEWELQGNWLNLNGGVHWASSSGHSHFGDLKDSVRRMRSWGARIEELSPDDVSTRIEPGLSLGDESIESVFLVREEGWVQPALMIQALLHGAVSEFNATIITDSVAGIVDGPDGIKRVSLASGQQVDADMVVVAAGPESDRVAQMAGGCLPLNRSSGILAVTAPSAALVSRVIVGPDIMMRPDGGGRVVMASEALTSVDESAVPTQDMPQITALLERARELVPTLANVPFESFRRGVRSLPSDGYPIVGFDPQVSGLYYAVMHSGITLSAGIANLVVNDLIDPDFEGLTAFRPDRFERANVFQGPSGE
jgi:glycine/D-amino acid oxidase-like deaminating enzyme